MAGERERVGVAAGERPQAVSPAIVSVREADFAYEERTVLKRISFDLERGEFVGIVGPNGSGKSTLLDLIDGVLQPAAGEVLVAGAPTRAYRRREMARRVALVPQRFSLEFDLSVREVVEMGSYCRAKTPEACADVDATLARLGVAELSERRFTELSGGERQLVILAQALMQQAELLLLDEPASNLDVSHQLRLFDLLRELNRDGQTVLCVLHDLNLALHYFDKLLVLSEGAVAAWGPSAEVLRPEILEDVYGIHAYVHHHAGRTYLTFSPRPRGRAPGTATPRTRVHLVCGGGTGSHLMRELVDRDFEVTAGVLNALDSDEVTGRELGLPMAIEAPFSPIGDQAHAENLALIEQADMVVLTDVPIGHGNARNVEALSAALACGATVLALEAVLTSDFSGTVAQLRGQPVEFLPDAAAVLARLG